MKTGAQHLLIGVAGHIDHGKTALVRTLTGIDTDRLPEEKRRGISIDLGFAHWRSEGVSFGIVDVPGHERFVRNMVAGATGINIALLVVAADDGVMPQTREHLDVMDLLGVEAGVVAITKTDLVEPSFLELVKDELLELAQGTFLERAPVVPVSSLTGAGFEPLKAALRDVAGRVGTRSGGRFFRMPIDRVFTMPGRGTIVTGSALCGEVRPGDELALLPSDRVVRVRSMQSHSTEETTCGAGQRCGINLAGVKVDDIHRGMELATPNFLKPTHRLLADLRLLPSAGRALRHRARATLHLGTQEVGCRLLLKSGDIEPGGAGVVEIRADAPCVAAWGQRFILRRLSPAMTIAGGTVLDPGIPVTRRLKRPEDDAERCRHADPSIRLGRLLSQRDPPEGTGAPRLRSENTEAGVSRPTSELELTAAARAGIDPEELPDLLTMLRERGDLIALDSKSEAFVHRDRWTMLGRAVMRVVEDALERRQPRRTLSPEEVRNACESVASPLVRDALIRHLIGEGELFERGGRIGLASGQPKLTKRQERLRDGIMRAISSAGLMPPSPRELAAALNASPEELLPLFALCREEGLIVPIDDSIDMTPESLEQGRLVLVRHFERHPRATLSELRIAWGVSRKYALAVCQWCDARGLTLRDGETRSAGAKLRTPLREAIDETETR